MEFEWHSFLSSFQHPLDLLVVLIFGHFVADYPLQGDKMAVEKCPGSDVTINWKWWLTAHTATHGFMVAILTGIPLLGLAEMAMHFCIDFGKCRIGYPLLVDQALHCFCKVLWVIFIMLMV